MFSKIKVQQNLFCLLISFSFCSQAQQIDLPSFKCFDFEHQEASFPFFKGDDVKVVFAIFNVKAEKEIESWIDPLVQKFIRKSGLLDAMFDAEFYSISFLNELQYNEMKAAGKKVENEISHELKSSTLYSRENKSTLQSLLGKKPDTTILVISGSGKLIGSVSGQFTPEKMEMIEDWISE
ncbi:MAG: hypothetical protein WED33_09975 [Bacteroidia bacterium]